MAEDMQISRGGVLSVVIIFMISLVSLVIHQILSMVGTATEQTLSMLWAIFLVSILAAVALTCALVLYYLHNLHSHTASLVTDVRRLTSGSTKNEALLTQINENILLSDTIKSIAFRDNDRTVLIQAIQQDIRREKWDSALFLVDELEHRFGDRHEAEKLRQDLLNHQNASTQEKIEAGISHIESLWIIHHYDEAKKEIENLMQLYPDSEEIRSLLGKTEEKLQQHKKELLDRWNKAAQNNDVEQGVEILKLLDNYLSPSEAAALEESARGVFRAKLHNMGVQFALFVTEKKWAQALKIGKQIIHEYPNSRMAQEVREKLDVLNKRAQEESVT